MNRNNIGNIFIICGCVIALIGCLLFLRSLPPLAGARTETSAPSRNAIDTEQLAHDVADILTRDGYVEKQVQAHPDIVMAALEKWKARQEENARNGTPVPIGTALAAARTDNAIVIGDPDAPKTLVEFFDFNCGYCRRTMPVVQALVERRPDIKIVLRQFPVIAPDSPRIAAIALAAKNQGMARAFFKAVATLKGPITPEIALDLIAATGADMARLHRDIESHDVLSQIQSDIKLGKSIDISSTPAWISHGRHISGFIPLAELEGEIDRSSEEAAGISH